jgi:DNA-binding CsgD family transcriptional regulator
LIGRAAELQALRSLVTAARNGLSGAVVVRGEPGIGKTALLSAATDALRGVRVVRIDGFEAETSIPYAGLQRVGAALQEYAGALSPRHAEALRVAWGLDDGPAPDRFLVGLAMLALCAAAGSDVPLVCVMDDAQWLDAESLGVLAFVARRLTAEATAFIFGTRDCDGGDIALAGVDELRLTGLDQRAAIELLAGVLPTGFDPFTAVQIAEATGGHPLALIDLGRELSLRQIHDLTLSSGHVPVGRRLEVHYLRQVREMPADVQQWLIIAASASDGRVELIEQCASQFELRTDCRELAARAQLVTAGGAVEFRHPLVRSAIYTATPGAERRRVHAALAERAGALGLVELEAWHAAESTTGRNAAVADRLNAVAERARRRGGLVSQSSLLARAAELTDDPRQRNERLLAAAEAAGSAGAAQLSREILGRVDPTHLDQVQRGRLLMAQAATAIFVADPAVVTTSTARLLEAADQLCDVDPDRECRALIQAFETSLVSERQMQGATLKDLGLRLESAAGTARSAAQAILQGLAAHVLMPYSEAAPLMRHALTTLMCLDDTTLPEFGFVGIAFAMALFDSAAAAQYLSRLASLARDAGALRALDTVLWVRSSFEVGRGDPATAAMFIEQVRELRRAIGYDAENVVNASYLAWTDVPTETVEAIGQLTLTMGFGGVHTMAEANLAVREIAGGSYAEAFARLEQLRARPFLHVSYLQLPDMVEAAVRSGHRDQGLRATAILTAMSDASPTPWLQGLAQRAQALLASDADAARHHEAAIAHLCDADTPADLGRAHLLYGEWLRRRKRRREAREHLHKAIDIFETIKAPMFADRALSELAATGEQISQREVVAGVPMTPREATVAKMAAAGATNADIAATLFVTANTVDYHLRKVFQKFGISSRRQLAERFNPAE